MRLLAFLIFSIFSNLGFALEGELYNGTTLEKVSFKDVIKSIPKGAVVFLGEQHGNGLIQKGQLAVLNELRANGHKINVGMEFLDYTQQSAVDEYRSGTLSEPDFLKKMAWGSVNFDFYRDQILFPKAELGEKTFALNSPRWLSGEISKNGLSNLSEEALKLLPPQLHLGRESYKKRFTEMMAGHVTSPEAMQRYFEAQSVWDETMSWNIAEAPVAADDTIVVVVGQFHIEYGGGLPYQYQQRFKGRPIVVIEELLYYDDEELPFKDLMPSPEYGPMSDYLLIVVEKS
ncbi:MAG: ChaN family lipoprotein [Bacteriovorax sp.]|nr:ChaN family lipoprotein [Bacteriovorax sp.]